MLDSLHMMSAIRSFNPRPSLLTDERPARTPQSPVSTYGFNPRPSLLTDESARMASMGTWVEKFQSTSVIADGRKALLIWRASSSASCFNPRPSLLTDESSLISLLGKMVRSFQSTSVIADGRKSFHFCERFGAVVVSIHVRHC